MWPSFGQWNTREILLGNFGESYFFSDKSKLHEGNYSIPLYSVFCLWTRDKDVNVWSCQSHLETMRVRHWPRTLTLLDHWANSSDHLLSAFSNLLKPLSVDFSVTCSKKKKSQLIRKCFPYMSNSYLFTTQCSLRIHTLRIIEFEGLSSRSEEKACPGGGQGMVNPI